MKNETSRSVDSMQPALLSLNRFAESLGVDDQADAIRHLNKTKAIFTAFGSDPFRQGLARLQVSAETSKDPRSQLKAIATLELIRAVLKKNGHSLESILRNAMTDRLPSLQLLETGDERIYMANALAYANGDWLVDYAAREMVDESAAEKARMAVAKALFREAGAIDRGFLALASAISNMPIDAGKGGDGVGKRFKRILVAARGALQVAKVPLGFETANALKLLLRKTFERSGPPMDLTVARDITAELARLLDDLVRSHLSILVDSEIYGVLNACRRWFPLSSWSTSATRASSLKDLASTIMEGVTLSAKQGVTDQKLFDALELAIGSRDKALQITRALAENSPGLPDDVQSWLRHGRVAPDVPSSTFAAQSALLRADEYVATALIEVTQLDRLLSASFGTEGNAEMRRVPNEIQKGMSAISIAVRNLADARGLTLFGEAGREAEFSPQQHVVISGIRESRKVRVVREGVERTDAAGNHQLLVKVIVEALK